MKILIITNRYPPYYEGGYESVCETTACGLKARGHEIHILTSTYGIDRPQEAKMVMRLLHCLPSSARKGYSIRFNQFKTAVVGRANYIITRNVLRRVKPDLVYVWQMGDMSIFPLLAVRDQELVHAFHLEDFWLLDCRRDFA